MIDSFVPSIINSTFWDSNIRINTDKLGCIENKQWLPGYLWLS